MTNTSAKNSLAKHLRFIDLFGGVGGIRLGLERAGIYRRSASNTGRNQSYPSGQESQGQPLSRPHPRDSTASSREPEKGDHSEGRGIHSDSIVTEQASEHGDRSIVHESPTTIRGGITSTAGGEAGPFGCVWYCEIDKYAVKIYNKNFGESWKPTDARGVRAKDIPAFDILCAGFPCQSFSMAGKRKGFEDTRGTLFFEIARIAKERQPRLLLLENVFGLLSHEEGRTFETILRVLDEVGYDAEWQVLNSKHFGVPQNRERVFIIGHLRGKAWREIFPIGEIVTGNNGSRSTPQGEGARVSALDSNYHKGGTTRQMIHYSFPDEEPRIYNDISPAISTPSGGYHLPFAIETVGQVEGLSKEKGRVVAETGVSPSLAESGGFPRAPLVGAIRTPTGSHAIPLVKRERKETSITTKPATYYTHLIPAEQRIRRLTPVECERLQGFPDNWTATGDDGKAISDTQRYKVCGNAVTVNVVEALGEAILQSMDA